MRDEATALEKIEPRPPEPSPVRPNRDWTPAAACAEPGPISIQLEARPAPHLPPPPIAVADYFRRRRRSLAGFSPEDLYANECLWAEICGAPKPPRIDPAPLPPTDRGASEEAAQQAEETARRPRNSGRGGVTRQLDDVRAFPVPVTPQSTVVAFPLSEGTRLCGGCGKPFKPYRGNSTFCSGVCRQRAYRERQSDRGTAADGADLQDSA
jgi:hypothetical protein